MNILIITAKIPYPLDEGGKISQFAIIDYLRKNNSIFLVLSRYCTEDEMNVQILRNLWPEVIIERIQISDSSIQLKNIGLRLLDLSVNPLRWIKKRMKLTKARLANEEKKEKSVYSEIGSPWIVQIGVVKSRKFIRELLNIVSKFKIDLIQIDLLDDIDLVFALPKEIKKVFVHHELKFVRLLTALKTVPDSEAYFNNYILDFVKSQEINMLKLYNGIFVFGEADRNKLAEFMPDNKIFITPFPVLDSYFKPIKPELLKINKLVFVGGEDHIPNKDAIQWYMNEICKEVNKRDDLILHVVGNWSNETIRKYNANNQILFTGFIEDLLSFCENSIMVVPVRIGSGIRAKILYAMAQGVPVISTSVGCEGIGASHKTELLVANNPEVFAEAIHTIVANPDIALKMVTNAQRLIRDKFSQKVAGELRQKCLNELIINH
jgi:glycosyltransferase involved in cell wall biosynthesis